jgi:ribose transport system ATP-binding protein
VAVLRLGVMRGSPGGGDGSATGLSCRDLTKRFPGVLAVDEVDLEVEPGRVLILLGENGAGKSTLARILSGVYRPDSGRMTLDGEPYQPASPAEAIAAGIGMIHQETSLLPGLSVAENIFLGRQPTRRGLVDRGAMATAAQEHLDRVGLRVDPGTPVARLSVAARQQVEIAKALSLAARILLLDEPTAALGTAESERLFAIVADLRQHGVAFVYITHRLAEVPRVGDRLVVMRDGRRVAGWDTADVAPDDLIEAMVGRTVDQVFPAPPQPQEEEVLRLEDLAVAGAFEGVSFSLRRGEILGIAGLVGAGRTTLARTLFGAQRPTAGRILAEGRPVDFHQPADAMEAGIVLVPEDRKEQGLVLELSLQDNMALPSLEHLAAGGVVRPSAVRRLAARLCRRLGIRGRPERPARTLSGGNQQKAVIAKWLPREPKVMIFDDPTRGIDVGAKAAIYQLLDELAGRGVGVILISSELPEVLGLSHRVLVLSRGRQTGLLDRAEAEEGRVMSLAVSG